jgi:protein-tyrosine phosphatase
MEKTNMIDLHCHILPGLDDGAENLEISLEMATMAASQGIRHIATTPHCVTGSAREVIENLLMLEELLKEARIPVRLYPGMEIFGTYDTARLLRENKLLTLNGSRYPLIEFTFHSDGEEETEILQSVIDAGYTPLVAHPERYSYICREPELVNRWKEMGCLFQVNRGSLLGRYGHSARQMGMALVRRGFATVVATDAHSSVVRTPRARDVYELLCEAVSPLAADTLMRHNPEWILRDKILPPVQPDWFA